jgi:hypothetical protein
MPTTFRFFLNAGVVISLSAAACGGKLTNAETLDDLGAGGAGGATTGAAGTTSGGTTTTGGTTTGGSTTTTGGSTTTGGTTTTTTGGSGAAGASGGRGGASGAAGAPGRGGAAGAAGAPTPGRGGAGGTGAGGAAPPGACPDAQPTNGDSCAGVPAATTCGFGGTNCVCNPPAGGGRGGRGDAGGNVWTCTPAEPEGLREDEI